MRTIPQIVTPDAPVGADLAILEIQNRLAEIQYNDAGTPTNWFKQSLIFGLAIRDEKENKPILYWKNKEYFNAWFDNYKSFCWFYETDPRQIQGRSSRFNFHLVVCYRQMMVARHLNYSIRENFIDTIIARAFEPVLAEEDMQTIQVFTDTNQVFANYDVQKINSVFKDDNYMCFRISFSHQEQFACTLLNVNDVESVGDLANFAVINDGSNTNALAWDAAINAAEYQIERAEVANPTNFVLVATVPDTFYNDPNLNNNYYYYRVRGVNGTTFGNYSGVEEILTYSIDQYTSPYLDLDARSASYFDFTSGINIENWLDKQNTQDFAALLGLSEPEYRSNGINSNAAVYVNALAGARIRAANGTPFNFMHQGNTFTTINVVLSGNNNFNQKVIYSSQNNQGGSGVHLGVSAPGDLAGGGIVTFTMRNSATVLGTLATPANTFLYNAVNVVVMRYESGSNNLFIDVFNSNGQEIVAGALSLPLFDIGGSAIPLAIGEGNATNVDEINTAQFQIVRSKLTDAEVAELGTALLEQYRN